MSKMVYQEQPNADYEERVRKRTAIGLSPERPTARATFQRPPGEGETRGCLWLVVWLVAALILATALLLAARLSGAAISWSGVQETVRSWTVNLVNQRSLVREMGDPVQPSSRYRLIAEDQFSQSQGVLVNNQQDGQWDLLYQPDDGVYRMQLAPNRLGWSTLGADALRKFRFDVALTIADLRPDSYGGILGRYQNNANFYLFAVDGYGRYQVQLWQESRLQTLIPWMESGKLNLAGSVNVLSLEDDGATLRLSINDQRLFEVIAPALPAGDVGVFGAAPPQTSAELAVDWLRLYEPGTTP